MASLRLLTSTATRGRAFGAVALVSIVLACSGKTTSGSPAGGGTSGGGTGASAGSVSSGGSTGGTGGSSVGGSTGGTGGSVVVRELGECDAPTPVLVDGVDTGTVHCDGAFFQRNTAGVCPSRVPRAGVMEGDENTECREDSDCTAAPLGWCGRPPGDWQASVACQYGCETDNDCGAGRLCACDDSAPAGVCVAASCRTNSDCSGEALCVAQSVLLCFNDPTSVVTKTFGCQQADDECVAGDECPPGQNLCVQGACLPGAGACGGGS